MILIGAISFALYFLFVWKSGRTYPLLYLALFVYFIQYIFSVYLIYNYYPELKRQMPIGQDQLFNYLIPALIFMFGGLFLFNRVIDIRKHLQRIDPKEAAQLGYILLAVSFFVAFACILV